jgi:hypothetical protein
MRTIKALACAAALVAGLATAVAQSNVYSLNVVGYYNVSVPQGGLNLLANQLNTTNNTLGALIPTAVDYTYIYMYSNGAYNGNQYLSPANYGNGWDYPNWVINPGQAFTIKDFNTPGGQSFTFVGEVLQGSLVNNVLTGPSADVNLCFRSSMVPQAGTLTGDLKVPPEDYDYVYVWDSVAQKYNGNQYLSPANYGNGWDSADPNGPVIGVGQAFAYKKFGNNVLSSWIRNFTVQ